MAKLLVHESAGIREFEIIDAEVHMGRELDNTLRLPDPSVSRHHCVLRKVGGGFEIQDLQSSNGVLVNGNRVQSSPLHDGDRITVGQVQLTFVDPRPEVGATVALNVLEAPPVPSGTVRMSAEQLAAIHLGKPPAEPEPKIQLQDQDQLATGPVSTPAMPPIPPPAPPPGPGSAQPSDLPPSLKGPATALLITAGLGIALQLFSLLRHLLGTAMPLVLPGGGANARLAQMMAGSLGVVSSVIGLAIGGVILAGALKMKEGRSYGFALAAAILAMVPCVSPCCCLGLPFGIWALVVLIKPEVKAAFRP